jgi:transcriptional regulator with XRE-family HTH domain
MTVPPPQKKQPPLGSTALLVKILRKVLLNLTQAELSARSGVDADLISRYENGTIEPTSRNLDRLLTAAGVLDLKQPLRRAADHLAALLSPPPPSPPPSPDDPLRIRNLLQHTSRRLRQSDSRLVTGEYSPPIRRDLETSALLVRFLRNVLLDCTVAELSRRTGIHKDVLSRYESGRVRTPAPANLDRLLAEARVLPLKEPLLRAMSDLATVLARQPRPEPSAEESPLLTPAEIDAFVGFAADLLHRTSLRLGLESDKFSPPMLKDGSGSDFREE